MHARSFVDSGAHRALEAERHRPLTEGSPRARPTQPPAAPWHLRHRLGASGQRAHHLRLSRGGSSGHGRRRLRQLRGVLGSGEHSGSGPVPASGARSGQSHGRPCQPRPRQRARAASGCSARRRAGRAGDGGAGGGLAAGSQPAAGRPRGTAGCAHSGAGRLRGGRAGEGDDQRTSPVRSVRLVLRGGGRGTARVRGVPGAGRAQRRRRVRAGGPVRVRCRHRDGAGDAATLRGSRTSGALPRADPGAWSAPRSQCGRGVHPQRRPGGGGHSGWR